MRRVAAVGRALALCAVLLQAGLAEPASARDVLRLEAVGAVAIRPGKRAAVGPKEAAIQAALREAVSRVAVDFMMDADPDRIPAQTGGAIPDGSQAQQIAELMRVLGSDMVRYTTSFRILEDRGERPALIADDPDAATEYVVIVEVHVDADQIEKQLVDKGLLARRAPQAAPGRVRLEVLGLSHYAAYEALEAVLIGDLGARSVAPTLLEPGRSVLEVETELVPGELLHRLLALPTPNLQFSALSSKRGSIRVSVLWTPPEPDASGDATRGAAAASGRGRKLLRSRR